MIENSAALVADMFMLQSSHFFVMKNQSESSVVFTDLVKTSTDQPKPITSLTHF